MEEESLKRNTDCVYFLASPFTCKKGADCEYRHSDMARLNPRDCWYWLSGNCLNPTCAFRHPPLEIHTEASSEPAAPPSSLNQPSVPVTKTTVPCYFFFNGFCNKGDKCPFLHETEETLSWKPQLTTNTIPDTVSAPPKKSPGPSETAIASDNKSIHIQPVQKPTPRKAAQTYVSEHEEEEAVEELTKSGSDPSLGSEHNSSEDELVKGYVARDEEWWESSPGFDVLVDGKTEEDTMLAYYEDDDALGEGYDNEEDHRDRDRDRDCLYMERRPAYVERGFIEYDPYEHPDRGRYRKPGRAPMDLHLPISGGRAHNNNNDVDLRDYLRKRRMFDGYGYLEAAHGFEFEEENKTRTRRRRLEMQAMKQRGLHTRIIVSKVERKNSTKSRSRSSHHNRSNELKPRRSNNNNHHHNTRRSVSSRREERRSSRGARPGSFAGPKSLAEIKQQKHGNGNGSVVDFEGPKPLSEILKDKNKTSTTTTT